MKTDIIKNSENQNNVNNIPLTSDGVFSKHSNLLHRPINSFKDLFGLKTQFSDGKTIESFPHFVTNDEAMINLVAYDDSDEMKQSKLIEAMGKRRLLISVKHHAIKPDSDPKESIKLQCTHAQLVVRSDSSVCTFNNPQDYQNGMFGSPEYPMIFLIPVFPETVPDKDIKEYEKNIILWATLLNTFSYFPDDYNGGDPLSVQNEEEALEYGNHVLNALAGDNESIQWIKNPSKHLYCAELVYLSLTLGITYPLTENKLSQSHYRVLKDQIRSKDFLNKNKNPYIKNIRLEAPQNGLVALEDRCLDKKDYFNSSLAIRPMLFSDMLTSFIKYTINRASLGERSGKYQHELFQSVKPMINSIMPGILNVEIESLFDDLEVVLKTEHQEYKEFKKNLIPVLDSINKAIGEISTANNTFIPPHTFLVRALEFEREGRVKGILGMKYFAHGVHKNLI